ncbi:MAG TPA: SDR family oxidoreductase [Dehalococcoidia bacterium]|nr:SDR family oxidoreductase [Dehalococcoidia bacterium]
MSPSPLRSAVDADRLILLTGGTGYIGGRLLKALEAAGHRVRCMARRPDFLRPRVADSTEVVEADVLTLSSLQKAMSGVDTAYYLVHAMGSAGAFEEEERRGAENFGKAAREAGVRRIIYLGGLGNDDSLSRHLASRQDVGRILRDSGVPTIEFRASIIIGSGSLSFEMVRALVNRLPVMVTPRWVRTISQPIAVEDVIAYLLEALDVAVTGSRVFEIGGSDRVSYRDILREYARQRRLKRLMIPVPLLTLRLSSLWLGLVTPVYARIGRKLIESISHETVVGNDDAVQTFSVRPRGINEAIERALTNEDQEMAETRWSDALSSRGPIQSWGGARFGSRLVDSRVVHVPQPPAAAFRPISQIGGETGWYYGTWLWRVRGFIDLLLSGPGTRRGRSHFRPLRPGDHIDFWRVEAIQPDRLLRLHAEMLLPGRAWLQFEVDTDDMGTVIRQTAIFDPIGLPGLLYWYGLFPVHSLIFAGMLRGIVRSVDKQADVEEAVGSPSA